MILGSPVIVAVILAREATVFRGPKWYIVIFIGVILAAVAVLAGGALTKNLGRRAARTSVLELQKLDKRAPILFLRAFRDDQVRLAPPKLSLLGYCFDLGNRESNLDVLLLEEGTDFGPVMALGNQNDPLPPYGAARRLAKRRRSIGSG